MGFLLFPVGRHQAARRRLFWNVGVVVTAVVANWLVLFAPPSATEGYVVRALIVGWLLVSLAPRLAMVATRADAETTCANLTSAAATLLLLTSSATAFVGAETTAIGFDIFASFLYVVAIRTEQQFDQGLRNSDSLARVHVTMTLAAGLWVLAASNPHPRKRRLTRACSERCAQIWRSSCPRASGSWRPWLRAPRSPSCSRCTRQQFPSHGAKSELPGLLNFLLRASEEKMRVFLITVELQKTAWEGMGWWVAAQYHIQRCRSGDRMRSHLALLFQDVPPDLRTAPGGSSRSALGAAVVSFDFTSRPFCGFSRIDDPTNWYAKFKGAVVEAYHIQAPDQHLLALRAHAAATRWAHNPPPYNDSFKFNAACFPFWPYPGASLDGRSRQERGTNCVGITLAIIEEALGKPLGLRFGFENYLPGLLPELLGELGVLGERGTPDPPGERVPLLRL